MVAIRASSLASNIEVRQSIAYRMMERECMFISSPRGKMERTSKTKWQKIPPRWFCSTSQLKIIWEINRKYSFKFVATMIEYVTVFCGSSSKVESVYLETAVELGELLALNGKTIVYGGGKVGLMGKLAEGVLSKGGKIIGVIPKFMKKIELGHNGITRLIEVETMHEREETMLKKGDCIVALPGGCGTMEELLQAIAWKKLKLIFAPIIILNINNYYSPLIEQLNRAVEQNFMRKEHRELWNVATSPQQTYDLVRYYDANVNQLSLLDIESDVT